MSGRWDQGHVFRRVLILIEKLGVETLFGEREDGFLETVLELVLHRLLLFIKRVTEPIVGHWVPAIKTIDLVQSDNEGSLSVTEQPNRLQSLRFQAVHDIDDENGDVTERRATGTQVGEGLVPWGIDNEQTRGLELHLVLRVNHSGLLSDCFDREVCSTDLLGDTTRFTFLNIGLTNLIQKLSLSGIDVTENTTDR